MMEMSMHKYKMKMSCTLSYLATQASPTCSNSRSRKGDLKTMGGVERLSSVILLSLPGGKGTKVFRKKIDELTCSWLQLIAISHVG
jgi:hypothetical protein